MEWNRFVVCNVTTLKQRCGSFCLFAGCIMVDTSPSKGHTIWLWPTRVSWSCPLYLRLSVCDLLLESVPVTEELSFRYSLTCL